MGVGAGAEPPVREASAPGRGGPPRKASEPCYRCGERARGAAAAADWFQPAGCCAGIRPSCSSSSSWSYIRSKDTCWRAAGFDDRIGISEGVSRRSELLVRLVPVT